MSEVPKIRFPGLPTVFTVLLCLCVSCGGANGINEFYATADMVDAGELVYLFWTTTGVDSCELDQGIGSVTTGEGLHALRPKTSATYTLTCVRGGTSFSRQAFVGVRNPAIDIVSFATSPEFIDPGDSFSLAWEVQNAQACSLDTGLGDAAVPGGAIDLTASTSSRFVLSCTGNSEPVSAETAIKVRRQGDWQLHARIRYERVESIASTSDGVNDGGLDYTASYFADMPPVPVRLVDDESGRTLDQSTVRNGAVTFEHSGANLVRLQFEARTTQPSIRIQDNTAGNALYVLESRFIDLSQGVTVPVSARSGWSDGRYRFARAAAPFAILDTSLRAANAVSTIASSDFPELRINWSELNRPESGRISEGQITTSFWDGSQLYILGQEDVDTDEYDDHVLVHEWGHYFETSFSRADSVGGAHSIGDLLDARVAFSEGWGNGLSAIVLFPDTIYSDSFGPEQVLTSFFDVQDNSGSADPNPGWFSESSIQAILLDLADDDADEPWDKVAIGLDAIIDVLQADQRTTSALTTVFSFLDGIKRVRPDAAGGVDDLTAKHKFGPVLDEWGTGESNTGSTVAGGGPGTLPLYRELNIPGGDIGLTFRGTVPFNHAGQNRYLKLSGYGGRIGVSVDAVQDVDLYVYDRGQLLVARDSLSGKEQGTFQSEEGVDYVVVIQGFGENEAYQADVDAFRP